MKNLVELSSETHKNLKVIEGSVFEAIKDQHVVNVQLNEACIAAAHFPLFFMSDPKSDRMSLSAINSLEVNKNLFVEDGVWQSAYQPTIMLTYPMRVMPAADKKSQFTIGIDEENVAFSETEGTQLFESDGKASPYLSRIVKLIEADMQHEIHTIQFCTELNDLSLITPAVIQVVYAQGKAHNLSGLYTIDEKALENLDLEQLDGLRKKGYLASIYAILISGYQLNLLLKKHNQVDGNETVNAVNMKLNKDDSETEKATETPSA